MRAMTKKIKWTGPIGNPGAPGPTLVGEPDHTWQVRYKARLDEVAREAAIRREALQKIVDDATLSKLAELAGIPQKKRSAFYGLVRHAVKELWRGMDVKGSPVRRAQIMKALAEYQAALDKVRELLTPEYAAVQNLPLTNELRTALERDFVSRHGKCRTLTFIRRPRGI
jgi:hypothetical protein